MYLQTGNCSEGGSCVPETDFIDGIMGLVPEFDVLLRCVFKVFCEVVDAFPTSRTYNKLLWPEGTLTNLERLPSNPFLLVSACPLRGKDYFD